MMTVLFVNPACLDPRITDQDDRVVPIGLYYLAAQLLDAGFSAAILNLAEVGAVPSDPRKADDVLTAALDAQHPDIVGFSVTSATRFSAMDGAAVVRRCLPRAWILFGGPGATFMGDFLFSACPALDIIVKGEGEKSTTSLVTALSAGDSTALDTIPGLLFRKTGSLVDTGPPALVEALDRLVHPSRYFTFQHLAMSRGCPGTCTFCGSPKFWGSRRVRFHSPEWFAEELIALARKGVSHFFISDDTFTMDRHRVIALCRRLIDAGLSISWNAISRVDHVDPELLSWMRKAGCIQISYGVESGAPPIQRTLGKAISRDQAEETFRHTTAHGIVPRAYFIYGSPGETRHTIRQSIDLLLRLKPLAAVFYLLMVFPGTRLYDRAQKKGDIDDATWTRKIEDLPWSELDHDLDFHRVKSFGNALRQAFYKRLPQFAHDLNLVDDPTLYPFHADFLSRLALTFSQGDYGTDPRVKDSDRTAAMLFNRALTYHPDRRAFLGLAMLLQKQGRPGQALTMLNQGLLHFAADKSLHICKGTCLMNLGRFQDALDCLRPFESSPEVQPYLAVCRDNQQVHP